MRVSLEERFWNKVKFPDMVGTDECWEWQTAKAGNGYGYFWFYGKLEYAHRVSYHLSIGPIPDNLQVLHNCPKGDNPACVNPAHLWLGTHLDNVSDMVKKGRSPKGNKHWSNLHPEKMAIGEKQGSSKLTYSKVEHLLLELAEGNKSQHELAREYGVGQSAVSNIFRKVTWKHVQLPNHGR